jgi:NodT family efflux transporter outer membrane factor (OMF) lipoprotein
MKKSSLVLAILPLAALSGCLSRELAVNPKVDVPDSFAQAREFAGADADEKAWWASFGDSALPGLVETALENNRSLKAAEARLQGAREARKGAIAALFPSFFAAGETLNDYTLVNPQGRTQGYLYGVGAKWDIDLFGMERSKARAATQLTYAEVERFRGAQLTVASETAKAWLTLRNVRERRKVLEEAIALQQRTLEVAEGRLPEGLSSTVDVDRARAKLAAAQALMPKLDMAEAKLASALSVLTGKELAALSLDSTADWNAVTVPQPPALLPSTVLLRRPDVQAARRTVQAQMHAVGAAKAAYWPQFSFSMLAGKEFLEFSPFLYAYTDHGVTNTRLTGDMTEASLSGTLPIFTFGKIRAAVKQQEARLDAVAALYENTILTAVGDTEAAYAAYAGTGRRLASLAECVNAAAAASGKAHDLYEIGGLADLPDVLGAEVLLQEQKDALLQASLEHALSAIDLYDAFGGSPLSPAQGGGK